MQGPVGGSLVDQQGFKFPRLNGQAPHAPTSAIHVRGNSGAWVNVERRGRGGVGGKGLRRSRTLFCSLLLVVGNAMGDLAFGFSGQMAIYLAFLRRPCETFGWMVYQLLDAPMVSWTQGFNMCILDEYYTDMA